MLPVHKRYANEKAISSTKLSRRFYIPRVLTYWLLGAILGSILFKSKCNYIIWTLAVTNFVLWPHIAYFVAIRSRDPRKTETIVLLFDSLIAGLWLPITSFNIICGVIGFATQGVNNISVGGPKQYLKGMFVYLAGVAITVPFVGFKFDTKFNTLAIFSSALLYLVFPSITGLVAYNLTQQLIKAKEKIKEKSAQMEGLAIKLAKYLSPQVYDTIFTGKKDVIIETYKKPLTVFFSDIVDFTETTENMHQDDLTKWLNEYLNEMAEIALEFNGTVDKYIGDAVMIFYGDPESLGEKEDAIKCVSMALKMREQAKKTGINIRIGINTGKCTVGNFGSDHRMDYTIIGGAVNLAARLESNSEAGKILISRSTYELIKDVIKCEPRGEILVKGIEKTIMTYWVESLRTNSV
jgi:class 3 adenylate cyclase